MTSRRSQLQEDTYFRVLRLLQDNPDMTQREIAQSLGLSTSGLNYCLKALIDKGWVKVHNFSQSKNKFGYEELLIGDNPKATQHARIMQAHEEFLPWPLLEEKLQALNMAVGVNDVPMIRGFLQQLVKGYAPSGEVVDWVHLANEREAKASGLE